MKPRIAITMGDPAGIGPEILLKALSDTRVHEWCRPVVYGDREWLENSASWLHLAPPVSINQASAVNLSHIVRGQLSSTAASSAIDAVVLAARHAICGDVDAMVTAPLNKEAMALAGCPFPGHTELLASVTGTSGYGMMLMADALRVVHVSTHVSLRTAIERVTPDRISECILLGHHACTDLGIGEPRIAVAGLNPHAGEHGLFGVEEIQVIGPTVERMVNMGLNVSGPIAPDTVFYRAARGEFDLVIAMYHDQGHIPVKMLGFDRGVNITLGLPIIRVSVDHGTAFDIAQDGIASAESMLFAIETAANMANIRARHRQ